MNIPVGFPLPMANDINSLCNMIPLIEFSSTFGELNVAYFFDDFQRYFFWNPWIFGIYRFPRFGVV